MKKIRFYILLCLRVTNIGYAFNVQESENNPSVWIFESGEKNKGRIERIRSEISLPEQSS